jgi:hypothetical protein
MPRGKSTNNLRRSFGNKNPRGDILIVVEGTTEENYFRSLKKELRLHTIYIDVESANGGDPKEVVNKAIKLWKKEGGWRKKGGKYDYVFCVFDHDNKPQKYQEALHLAQENRFVSITSIPCFEFWFLLHYEYNINEFASPQDLEKRLEPHLISAGFLKKGESYEDKKGDEKLYEKLKPKQDNACAFALRLTKKLPNRHGLTNPSTKVNCLVKLLQRQKDFT